MLIYGEAGIGKTTLLRAFQAAVVGRVRLLVGACDDLLTPRTFGPLRDAADAADGELATALVGEPDRENVYQALLADLSGNGPPTVLVVEDVHWADDATLDALRFAIRRLAGTRAVILLTYRDDEIDPDHAMRSLLGSLVGVPLLRLPLQPLSATTVVELGDQVGVDGAAVYAVTGGNPFFVTEALADPCETVPSTVVDAVMARIARLSSGTRRALDQLAVVPTHLETWLADELWGGLDTLAEAETLGIVEVRPEGVAFRHELARRAVEQSLPASRRIQLNRAVVRALLDHGNADLSRIVHHAVAAGDVDTALSSGLAAAREATRLGSHRQALSHYEHVVAYLGQLSLDTRAHVLDEYAWQLYAAHRYHEAAEVAQEAVELHQRGDDQVALGNSLVVLSRAAYMADRPVDAVTAVDRAVRILDMTGDMSAQAYARTYQGALLALTDRPTEALDRLAAARDLAEVAGRRDLVALCLNYLGGARVDMGDEDGVDDIRRGLALALELPHHEYVARAYTNLGEDLFRLRRYGELEACIAEGIAYAEEHELPGHVYNLRAHQAMLMMTRGQWQPAETLLRELVASISDPGQLARLTLPALGRLLARRGDPEAEEVVKRAWKTAQRGDAVQALAPAGLAVLEWAWLAGDLVLAREQIDVLLERTTVTAAGLRYRGELLGYLRRIGAPTAPFERCPPEWDASLRGDWRRAVREWERIGDPFERAMELAFSGDVSATLEGLEVIDVLGASATAALVRRQLRRLGVARVPRGPQVSSRANPAGLTNRQVDVLALLAEGLTNAEIAERLVLSRRTVDHHVSAVLTKLGASSRREAARRAADLPLSRPPATPRP